MLKLRGTHHLLNTSSSPDPFMVHKLSCQCNLNVLYAWLCMQVGVQLTVPGHPGAPGSTITINEGTSINVTLRITNPKGTALGGGTIAWGWSYPQHILTQQDMAAAESAAGLVVPSPAFNIPAMLDIITVSITKSRLPGDDDEEEVVATSSISLQVSPPVPQLQQNACLPC